MAKQYFLNNVMTSASESYFAGEVFAECECCGKPIYKATEALDGEYYVEMYENEYVHVDCVTAWVNEHKKEAV